MRVFGQFRYGVVASYGNWWPTWSCSITVTMLTSPRGGVSHGFWQPNCPIETDNDQKLRKKIKDNYRRFQSSGNPTNNFVWPHRWLQWAINDRVETHFLARLQESWLLFQALHFVVAAASPGNHWLTGLLPQDWIESTRVEPACPKAALLERREVTTANVTSTPTT